MYRHKLTDEHGQSHDLLPGPSFYGDDAPALAQSAFESGMRYVNVNRVPYLDGRPFTGLIERHWGARFHFRDGLLNDPEPMTPAVFEPGPRGQACFYKNGVRDDPCEGVPALIPGNSASPTFFNMGAPRPAGACVVDEQALAAVKDALPRTPGLLDGVDLMALFTKGPYQDAPRTLPGYAASPGGTRLKQNYPRFR